jgi:hypothetical protein
VVLSVESFEVPLPYQCSRLQPAGEVHSEYEGKSGHSWNTVGVLSMTRQIGPMTLIRTLTSDEE